MSLAPAIVKVDWIRLDNEHGSITVDTAGATRRWAL
jgi:hypothetical protein